MRNLFKRSKLIVLGVDTAREAVRISVSSVCRFRWSRARTRLIASYLQTHQVRKLQIGSGPVRLEGWLNADLRPHQSDIIFMDATEVFPFEDATLDYICAEHLVQALPYEGTKQMLRECYRVLKPGGALRISTPDLRKLAGMYRADRSQVEERYIRWYVDKNAPWADGHGAGFVLNAIFREESFLFDRETLSLLFERAGFVDVAERQPGESPDAHLRGLERHGQVIGDEALNECETIVMEARRPAEIGADPGNKGNQHDDSRAVVELR